MSDAATALQAVRAVGHAAQRMLGHADTTEAEVAGLWANPDGLRGPKPFEQALAERRSDGRDRVERERRIGQAAIEEARAGLSAARGQFDRYRDRDAERRSWDRHRGMLDSGWQPAEVIAYAGQQDDLHGLRVLIDELPPYLLAKVGPGGRATVARHADRQYQAIEDAMSPLVSDDERSLFAGEHLLERNEQRLEASHRLAVKRVLGSADAADRLEYGLVADDAWHGMLSIEPDDFSEPHGPVERASAPAEPVEA